MKAQRSSGIAYFSVQHGIVTMNLDAAKTPLVHGVANHFANSPGVATGMHERKSYQPRRIPAHDTRELSVGFVIVAVKRGHHDSSVDPRHFGPAQIWLDRCVCVPGCGHQISRTRMTMRIDNHCLNEEPQTAACLLAGLK